MILQIYRALLRLPDFKGKSRIIKLWRGLFFRPHLFTAAEGFVMELDPIEWTQSDLLRDGKIESSTSALFKRLLERGDTYVDVGAHVGYHTLVARSCVGPAGRVIAVEPQPYNCEKLLANWRANSFENLALYIAAIGETDSVVCLHQQTATDSTRLSLCLESVNDEALAFHVPLKRLDAILKEQAVEAVRLLKVDVEGFELEVLNSLGKFAPTVENIILEVLDTEEHISPKSAALIQELRRHNFELNTVEGNVWHQLTPLPENNLWATRPSSNLLNPQ
jgi:FkbM family methyltransferase